ncbi:MAG: response regulator [Desulfobacteraceae bacterium]|nr:response regulator [Desulfobacteraceae bacterium]
MSRILIVDDKDENLYMLKSLLSGNGHEVVTAANGAEAMASGRDNPPDLIVSDILMPVMDGFELCRQWKKDPRSNRIPFVFYTATYTDTKDEKFALSLGAALFIRKPADPEDFMRKIKGVIEASEKKELTVSSMPIERESDYLKLYSDRLVKKLEDKMLESKLANEALEREIAKREKIEATLAGEKERLKLALEAADLGMWDFNPTTLVDVHLSDRWLTMLGYGADELPQSYDTWKSLLHPDDRDPSIRRLNLHVAGKADYDVEFRLKSKNGDYLWMQSIGKVVAWDSDNRPIRMIGIQRDITENKHLEIHRKRMEDQLRQSQKMEAIGTLAGGIAHDFNNILAIIIGNAELASQDLPENHVAMENLNELSRAGMRAKELVKQILKFSRRSKEEFIPTKVSRIADDALNLLRATLPSTINIVKDINVKSDTVLADATQLHQVIMNLCTNAAYAMGDMKGELRVVMKHLEMDRAAITSFPGLSVGPHLLLTVEDTGGGISPDIMSHVFDPYFTTKPPGLGTGMGLAIVHNIVKNHQGSISVYSEPHKGTIFRIFLPVVQTGAIKKTVTMDELVKGTERVLFVDDEPVIARMGLQMLERLGYQVKMFTGSMDALDAVMEDPEAFDLVVTDMTMPNLTGVNLAEKIHGFRPDLPIILCTGFSHDVNTQRMATIGIRAVIKKPFVLRDIADIVRQVLDAGRT